MLLNHVTSNWNCSCSSENEAWSKPQWTVTAKTDCMDLQQRYVCTFPEFQGIHYHSRWSMKPFKKKSRNLLFRYLSIYHFWSHTGGLKSIPKFNIILGTTIQHFVFITSNSITRFKYVCQSVRDSLESFVFKEGRGCCGTHNTESQQPHWLNNGTWKQSHMIS